MYSSSRSAPACRPDRLCPHMLMSSTRPALKTGPCPTVQPRLSGSRRERLTEFRGSGVPMRKYSSYSTCTHDRAAFVQMMSDASE